MALKKITDLPAVTLLESGAQIEVAQGGTSQKESILGVSNFSHGIDMGGLVEQSVEVQAIFDGASAGDTIIFGPGTILINIGDLDIDKSLTIIGRGTTFKTAGSLKIFNVTANDVTIKGITFLANNNFAGQYGIYFDDVNRFIVSNCKFTTIRQGVRVGSTIVTTGNLLSAVHACKFDACNIGYLGDGRGEYVNITSCGFQTCLTGLDFDAGNVSVIGAMITKGTTGMIVRGGPNDSHGIISGCMINHQSTNSLVFDGIANGHTVESCHIYQGPILIKDSEGVGFRGGIIDVNAINFENAVGATFIGTKHDDAFTNTVDKEFNGAPASTTIGHNNYLLDGTPYTALD